MKMCVFEEYVGMGVSGWCKREWCSVWIVYVLYSVDVSVLC